MKEKPPFYKLKLCERIVDIELLVLLLYAIIFIVIIWKNPSYMRNSRVM